ncbi:hypothetical protein EBI01_05570 [Marinomonas rhizomae]|uniref:Lipoprotein n=1 Tax=Marinomonas rhizomae TaxID=491948 RepID=A0A366JB32_9GAMM|nr:hypothetical protein [Marinomonas rhizomae]RBP84246.1 hypothetical protein DFP80_104149 [Marinomonas rhizomae]RNF74568.1 hypothetical protein EBI01_05570 [Marinomonas rhizomae]
MRNVVTLLLMCAFFLVGCAPLSVDLSESEYQSALYMATEPKHVNNITVINRASDAEIKNHLLGNSFIPIKTTVSPQLTVESDINLLLAETLIVKGDADKSLIVTIRKADVYRVTDTADRIPFVSLVIAGRDTEFVMFVALSLEVRKGGAIVDSYSVNHEVKIIGKATTSSAIAESYQQLIAKYRADVLGDIQRNFIDKSL